MGAEATAQVAARLAATLAAARKLAAERWLLIAARPSGLAWLASPAVAQVAAQVAARLHATNKNKIA